MSAQIPILTYHSIDSTGSVISTAPEIFRKQMEILRQSSVKVLPLKDLASLLIQKKQLENAAAITFDDGFKNFFTDALPILKDFGFRPTVFLVTSYCGKDNHWYGQPDKIPTLELMSWDEVAEASEFVDFGVHTANHPDLTQMPTGKLEEEISGARDVLKQRIPVQECAFAYPYGKANDQARRIVEKQFFAACSTELNFASVSSDLYFLPRIDMYYFARNSVFDSFGTLAFRRYIEFRNLLRRIREAVTK